MHYTGPTFRPPFEASSLLIQVTAGCSHNACTFCTMYKDVPFSISPMDEVLADIAEAALYRPHARRVFLVNGDAFCLPTEQLLEIAEAIHTNLPEVTRIASYASINNLRSKSVDELRALAQAGYGELNIGLESGLDDVLAFMNKGFTLAEAREQLGKLNEAGMPLSLNIINAAAGPERIIEHAEANAAIVNEVQPCLLFVSPLHVDPGSEWEKIVEAGEFAECTLGQYLQEEIAFLQGLEQRDCVFFGLHVSNPIPVQGWLPRDKKQLLYALCDGMAAIPQHMLDSHPAKGAEGSLR